MTFGFNSAMSQLLGRYFEPLWKLFSYFNRASLEAKRQADAEWAAMPLAVQLEYLMENEPVIPNDFNLAKIGLRHRKWQCFGVTLIIIAIYILVFKLSEVEPFYSFFLFMLSPVVCIVFVTTYLFSKKVHMRWVEHYMPRVQAEFDAHALKVREVIMDWLAKPEGEREIGFLRELNQHWDIQNDSKLRRYFDRHSDESWKLEAIIAVYRFQVDRAYAALEPFQKKYEKALNA